MEHNGEMPESQATNPFCLMGQRNSTATNDEFFLLENDPLVILVFQSYLLRFGFGDSFFRGFDYVFGSLG